MEERLEGEALAQSTDSSNTSNNAMKSSSRTSLLTMDQKHSSSDIFISISGLIGAGKSTLATKLAEKMGLPCFYEPVMDNEYLSDFYRDPARYSFPLQVTLSLINYCVLLNPPPLSSSLQIYLLNRRFQQHQSIIWQGQGGVQDRTIYEDSVFAKVRTSKKSSLKPNDAFDELNRSHLFLQVLMESNLMEEREYRTYLSLFSNMSNFM